MTTRKKALLGIGVLCSLLVLGLIMQFLLSEEGAAWFARLRAPEKPAMPGQAAPSGETEQAAETTAAAPPVLEPEPAETGEIIDLLRGSYVEAPALLGISLDQNTLPEVMRQAGAKIGLSATSTATGSQAAVLALLPGMIGYWRTGSLDKTEITAFLEKWAEWKAGGLQGLILDLRRAGHALSMAQAADMAGLWVNPGLPLFSVQGLNVPQQVFVSERQPLERANDFPLVVVTGAETRGAGEMLARVLQRQAAAVVIGQATPGEAGVYIEKKLKSGRYARCATAGASLPEGGALLGRPLFPDAAVVPGAQELEAFASVKKAQDLPLQIVDAVSKRHPNPRLRLSTETAPVETDAGEAPEAKPEETAKQKDRTLQRAWDVATGLRAHVRPSAVPAG